MTDQRENGPTSAAQPGADPVVDDQTNLGADGPSAGEGSVTASGNAADEAHPADAAHADTPPAADQAPGVDQAPGADETRAADTPATGDRPADPAGTGSGSTGDAETSVLTPDPALNPPDADKQVTASGNAADEANPAPDVRTDINPEPETQVLVRDDAAAKTDATAAKTDSTAAKGGDTTVLGGSADPETKVLHRDPEAAGKAAGVAGVAAAPGLYRDDKRDDARTTTIGDPDPDGDGLSAAEKAEQERAAQRAAERAERNRALGKVSRPTPEAPAEVVVPPTRTTDKWHGSLGLFVLRLVLGAIFLIHGIQHLTALTDTQNFIDQNTVLPYPEILGWVLSIGEIAIGAALIFGLLVRVAGFGVLAIGVLALALVLWGVNNPFQPDRPGFIGELELLLAANGLLLLLLGGGRWSLDGAFRRRRRLKKEAKLAGN